MLSQLTLLPELRRVNLTDSGHRPKITEVRLAHLGKLTNLKTLHLGKLNGVSDAELVRP